MDNAGLKMTDNIAGVEIAGMEKDGLENDIREFGK